MLAYLRKGETFAELAAGFGGQCDHRLEIRERDRRPARRPGAEAPHGGPGRKEGRACLRSPGERANAQLKNWCILRCCPWRAGQLAKAIHALQTREA